MEAPDSLSLNRITLLTRIGLLREGLETIFKFVWELPKKTSQFTIRVSVAVCVVLPEVPVTVTA